MSLRLATKIMKIKNKIYYMEASGGGARGDEAGGGGIGGGLQWRRGLEDGV